MLNEHKIQLPRIIAHDLKHVPSIGSVELTFMLESVKDMHRKVDLLLDLRKEVSTLQAVVTSLAS